MEFNRKIDKKRAQGWDYNPYFRTGAMQIGIVLYAIVEEHH
jgi:hypothetical protein